jgi:DNA-binding beta-propeller fold protein YncE
VKGAGGPSVLKRLGLFRAVVLVFLALISVACVLWPIVALVWSALDESKAMSTDRLPQLATGTDVPPATAMRLLTSSAAYALGASLVGALLAWPAGRAVRASIDLSMTPRSLWRSRVLIWLVALAVLPLAVPTWLLSSAMWLSVGPGTIIGDFAERHDAMGALRIASLAAALIAWSSALTFAALLFARPAGTSRSVLLQRLDGFGLVARLRAAVAADGARLAWGVTASTIFLMGETTVFDLAQVQTYGFELRVRDALGATHADVLRAALPLIALTTIAVLCLPRTLGAVGAQRARQRLLESNGAAFIARQHLWPVLFGCVLPATLCVFLLRALVAIPRAREFFTLHGEALVTTLLVSSVAAALTVLWTVSLRIGLDSPVRAMRMLVRTVALVALLAAILPSTLAAGALESAYNHHATALIYDTPVIVVLLLLLRAMAVGSMVVLVQAAVEEQASARLRMLDGSSLVSLWRGLRAELGVTISIAFPIALAWSLGELTASGRLAPPGMAWFATDILNAIHYQRPETVLLGAAVLLAIGLLGALVTSYLLLKSGGISAVRFGSHGLVLLACVCGACFMVACETHDASGTSDAQRAASSNAGNDAASQSDSSGAIDPPGFDKDAPVVQRALPVEFALAGVGRGPGQFNGPRVVACDLAANETYVIDKDARVQRFDRSGNLLTQWKMPKTARGKPVGATVAPDGSLVILDTHEHRVVAYSPDGEELWTLGSYGREHGQFIYPTDVAFSPDGRMFISEYGGNDRIQVFSRDRDFLYAFGACGIGDREFLRPQALAYDAERDELYVADTGNHRVAVFTGDGEFRRSLGGPGREEGKLSYPFGVVLEIDGVPSVVANGLVRNHDEPPAGSRGPGRRTVIVAENSNHRVQRLDAATGEVIAVAGGIGRGEGRLKYPWAVEPAWPDSKGVWRVAVCDHGNSRVLFFALPDRVPASADASDSAERAVK